MNMKEEKYRPGLSRVAVPSPTLPPATTTNAWVLGKQNVIVVDPAGVKEKFQKQLGDILSNRRVKAIFLTHHHRDHIGGAVHLAKSTGAEIICSAYTAQKLPFEVDRHLVADEELRIDEESWKIIWTPGHAKGHLCLFSQSTKDLVAGDMVAGVGTILIDVPEGNLADYLHSLNALKKLSPLRLLPAHGPAISPAISYLEKYIDHRNMRTRQVKQAINKGLHHPLQIVKFIYTELNPVYYPIAARQINCHLDWLIENGEVQQQEEGFYMSQRKG